VREFLLEIEPDEFSMAALRRELLVIAPARHELTATVPYGLEVADAPRDCTSPRGPGRVVYLSARIEQLPESEIRALVFEMLAYVFALARGVDEKTAVQLGRGRGTVERWNGKRKTAA